MINSTEKMENWITKVREGSKNHAMIKKMSDGKWYHISNRHAEPILELKLAADRGNGIQPEYFYSSGAPDTNNGICYTIVLKNDEKLLFSDGSFTAAFGFEESSVQGTVTEIAPTQTNLKALFVYIRTANVHTIIFSHEKAKTVSVMYELAHAPEDAVTYCMADIFAIPNENTISEEGGLYYEQ